MSDQDHLATVHKPVTITVELLKCDEPMPSGNTYPRAVVESAMAEFRTAAVMGPVYGAYDPEDTGTGVKVTEISHQVTSLYMKDDTLVADLTVVPKGKSAELIDWLRKGGTIKMAPRGFGEVDEDGVVSEYKIATVDIFPDLDPDGDFE